MLSLALGVGGCAAADSGLLPAPSDAPRTASSTTSVSGTPADGRTLRSLGFTNGPVDQFSLPLSSAVSAMVDQENNVTVVLMQPRAVEVAEYLRRTLPDSGFTITDDDPAALAMTFRGFGWTGSFTGNANAAAVLLRPR